MPSVYTCLNANEQNMKFHQYENSNETHWTFNTIGVNGHLPPVVSVLCVDMRCYFVLRSVWAATTSWTLRSRRTPAYSVGAADSPATLSKAPSPLTTCPTVTKESGRHLVLRACELCVCDAALFFIFLFFFTGYNQMFIIPVGATTISIRETVATRNYLGESLPTH